MKNTIDRLTAMVLLMGVLIIPELFSQTYYSAGINHEYNTNPFRLPDGADDYITQLSMGIQRDWDKTSLRYLGAYARFDRNMDRNYYWHQLFLSHGDSARLYLSLDNRINKSDYNYYDYVSAKGGYSYQSFQNRMLINVGANLSLNTFTHLEELNNVLLSGYVSFNRSFATRTSLIGAVNVNYKSYLNNYPELEATAVPEVQASVSMNPDGGWGRGRNNWYYPASNDHSSVSQIKISLRLAQSLAKFTGMALQYNRQFALSRQDRSIAGLTTGYSQESQIFDDPLGYEGQTAGLELTQIFPDGIAFKAAGYWKEKNYISQGIYLDEEIYQESVLRQDRYRTVWVTLQKRWTFDKFPAINWNLNYQWLDNSSNSYWYNYKNQTLTTGIEFNF